MTEHVSMLILALSSKHLRTANMSCYIVVVLSFFHSFDLPSSIRSDSQENKLEIFLFFLNFIENEAKRFIYCLCIQQKLRNYSFSTRLANTHLEINVLFVCSLAELCYTDRFKSRNSKAESSGLETNTVCTTAATTNT